MVVCARFTDGKPALIEEAAITLRRVVPVLWVPTNIYVELGATEVELDFAYLSTGCPEKTIPAIFTHNSRTQSNFSTL